MATLQKKKADDPRRAVSHNPQTLPERPAAPNAPWVPPQQQHARSSSAQIPNSKLLAPLAPPAEIHRRPIGGSESSLSMRASSTNTSPVDSRPTSSYNSSNPNSPYRGNLAPGHAQTLAVKTAGSPESSPTRLNKRRSWFSGGDKKLTKHGSKDIKEEKPAAWIIGIQGSRPAYNLTPLLTGQQVPELWNPQGNAYIYLFPRTSGHGPSFCVDSSIFAASSVLTELAFGKVYSIPGAGMSTASLNQAHSKRKPSVDRTPTMGSRNASPAAVYRAASGSHSDPSEDPLDFRGSEETESGPVHLYLPISLSADGAVTGPGKRRPSLTTNDIDTLVSVRNLFAFLIGHSIVATERRSSTFGIFMKISDLLQSFNFSNLDGSTFGEVAHASFESYVDELKIADVRQSRERTIEGIVLGERMRSVMLYNESFTHGVGRWEDILEMHNPKFELVSAITKTRMERAALDLQSRTQNINQKLANFDFPGMFAGIMNSKSSSESKTVRFSVWRESFMSMRKWFMGYYRSKYGAWLPKASSKKNNLETSGLNRLVLRDLYKDLSDLYDLIVDRKALTTRTTDMVMVDDDTEDAHGSLQIALRKVMNEYDRSTPPVQPPMPFDLPLVPTLGLVGDPKADIKARMKKLKKEQLFKILRDSYNPDSYAIPETPFLAAFKEFEYSQAAHCTIGHITDLRHGQWLFLYAVLQSLPMLVVDAPGMRYTHGVEYFLCEPPRSGVPWAADSGGVTRQYYAVGGNPSNVVMLPSDIIEFGIEGVYRRSHCWIQADKWSAALGGIAAQVAQETLHGAGAAMPAGLPLPPSNTDPGSAPGSRDNSPSGMGTPRRGGGGSNRASMLLGPGLEALPMPPGVFADMGGGVRTPPGSSHGSPIMGPVRGSPKARPVSQADAAKTFDAILGAMDKDGGAGKEGKRGRKK